MSIQPNGRDSIRTVVLVHGGSFKPEREALEMLWREALAAGLERDHADAGGRALLEGLRIQFVYYGDLVNTVLRQAGDATDPVLDLEDRRVDLKRLASLDSKKKFRRVHYEAVPGKSSVAEFVAGVAAPVLNVLHVADRVLTRQLPALGAYLGASGDFRIACEKRLLAVLSPTLARGDDVLLISHGMGSVVSYDVLWRLTHDPVVSEPVGGRRVRTWITLGSPLASEYVKQQLRGADESAKRRYPEKVINWFNVAAEDDFYSHDKTVANDFGAMLKQHQISSIRDYVIYNLALRYGRSNPHNALGYLIHPRVARLLADWLSDAPPP